MAEKLDGLPVRLSRTSADPERPRSTPERRLPPDKPRYAIQRMEKGESLLLRYRYVEKADAYPYGRDRGQKPVMSLREFGDRFRQFQHEPAPNTRREHGASEKERWRMRPTASEFFYPENYAAREPIPPITLSDWRSPPRWRASMQAPLIMRARTDIITARQYK